MLTDRVRLDKIFKYLPPILVTLGLALLAAILKGGATMVADMSVNLAAAMGVAVGSRVEGSTCLLGEVH